MQKIHLKYPVINKDVMVSCWLRLSVLFTNILTRDTHGDGFARVPITLLHTFDDSCNKPTHLYTADAVSVSSVFEFCCILSFVSPHLLLLSYMFLWSCLCSCCSFTLCSHCFLVPSLLYVRRAIVLVFDLKGRSLVAPEHRALNSKWKIFLFLTIKVNAGHVKIN